MCCVYSVYVCMCFNCYIKFYTKYMQINTCTDVVNHDIIILCNLLSLLKLILL